MLEWQLTACASSSVFIVEIRHQVPVQTWLVVNVRDFAVLANAHYKKLSPKSAGQCVDCCDCQDYSVLWCWPVHIADS